MPARGGLSGGGLIPGPALPSLDNVIEALMTPGIVGEHAIGFDEFLGEMMVAGRPGQWRKIDDVTLANWRRILSRLGHDYAIPDVGRETMRDAVMVAAAANTFDTAKTWLNDTVPAWDGVPRIERFLATYYSAEDTPYTRAVSLYLFTGLAGRIMVPGIQADMALILVGPQGVGKSTGLQYLVPALEFFAEINLNMKDDDLARIMRGKLIVELGELKGLRGAALEHVKSFLTRRIEQWIAKFKEFSTSYPRRSLLVGTTNDDDFLDDPTGARRFLPVNVGLVDRDGIVRDRNQLWAEARDRFALDGLLWKDAERLAREIHADFTNIDPWDEAVGRWLAERDAEEGAQPFTAVEALQGALMLPVAQINHGHKRRIAGILKRRGYHDGRCYLGGVRVRAWDKVTPGYGPGAH